MLLFGLVGGAFMSRGVLRRLDSISRTSAEIVAGDFSRRVPLTGAHDEFDVLAENLNRMFERIERLMKGMREVADSVAHDLRTPLNRLRNRLEEAQRRLDPQNPMAADIDAAIAETDRLIATFNALLLIAEADTGVARGAMTQIDFSAVIEGRGGTLCTAGRRERLRAFHRAVGRADGGRQPQPDQPGARQSDRQCDQIHAARRAHAILLAKRLWASISPWPTAVRAFPKASAPAWWSVSYGSKPAAIRRAPDSASAWSPPSRGCTMRVYAGRQCAGPQSDDLVPARSAQQTARRIRANRRFRRDVFTLHDMGLCESRCCKNQRS